MKTENFRSHNIPENSNKTNIENFLKENNIDQNDPKIQKIIKLLEIEKAKTKEETKDKLLWLLANVKGDSLYMEEKRSYQEKKNGKTENNKQQVSKTDNSIQTTVLNKTKEDLGKNKVSELKKNGKTENNKLQVSKTDNSTQTTLLNKTEEDLGKNKVSELKNNGKIENKKQYNPFYNPYRDYTKKIYNLDPRYTTDPYTSNYDYLTNEISPASNVVSNSYVNRSKGTSSISQKTASTNPAGMPKNGTSVNGWNGKIGNTNISIKGSGKFHYDKKNKSVTITNGNSSTCAGIACVQNFER